MCNCCNSSTKDVHQRIWLFYQIISWLKTPKKVFSVRSEEQNLCPCCRGAMGVIGSRKRKYINDVGEKIILVIRRLRCLQCHRIHHELPDLLVPYKHYGRDSIEAVLSGDATLTVAADESTICRWRNWFFRWANHFLGCLISIHTRENHGSVEEKIRLPQSPLQRIWHFVGDAPGWLARVVRPVVNSNFWIHTQLAFLS